MPTTASVTTTVTYTDAGGVEGSVQESDTVSDTSTDSLSGSGGSGGASTDANEPDGSGGSERRERNKPIPDGNTLKLAEVTISLVCGETPQGPITATATGKGNVSAAGHVEGNCVIATGVTRLASPTGGTEIKTVTTRACCE